MGKLRKTSAVIAGAVMAASVLPSFSGTAANKTSAEITRSVVIDGKTANKAENMLYRGNGMVSANNSSRLLLDYKQKSPEAYREILEYLFGSDGLAISHLKIEMGADINSSSGTEPSVKRTEEETADVTRGAGYQLAADAKAVNPDLTLDMLWWSEPEWVSGADDVYAARYKWYKETLDAAYNTYGLKFDYVSAVQNERAYDSEWIKYLSAHLKAESDAPYDYSKIKIVGGDEVCTWNIADEMLEDEELRDAIDVVGSHYTSRASDSAKKLAEEYGKELWFSEASSPMEYSQGTYHFDGTGSGISGINGLLDIATRFITMYSGGYMTLCEYQPAVAAYYDGVTYCQKQMILANEPWSGYYMLDSGFFMGLHFSQFINKGWAFIDSACYADGDVGGDGHAIVVATYSYMTAADTETGDYSTVITNTTAEPITYNFAVKNIDKADSIVHIRETRGPDDGSYDSNYFKDVGSIAPEYRGEVYTYSVTVKPYSLVTVSTLDISEKDRQNDRVSKLLPLPYTDDFEYDDAMLASRGGAPLYTTDEGGAFEVVSDGGSKYLMQKITPDIKAGEWGSTPAPVTNFGDDRWFNYSAEVKVRFAPSDTPEQNYTGVGLRYILADSGESGYWLKLSENGSWELKKNNTTIESGKTDFSAENWTPIRIEAVNGTVRAVIDGVQVCTYSTPADTSVMSAGRAALYSSYNNNCFDDVVIEPLGDNYAVTRLDNTDSSICYIGSWEHNCMSSFRNSKRTISSGGDGTSFAMQFEGTGFAVTGANKSKAVISVTVDGEVLESGYTTPKTGSREISYIISGLENGKHLAVVKVISGSLALDGIELYGTPKEEPAADEAVKEDAPENESENSSENDEMNITSFIGYRCWSAGCWYISEAKRKKSADDRQRYTNIIYGYPFKTSHKNAYISRKQ